MEDIKFIQKYSEVVLENFNAVLKQNLLFQAKLALYEEQTDRIQKESHTVEELKKEINKLISEKTNLENQLRSANTKVDPERVRLQSALNEAYRKNSELQKQIEEKELVLKQIEEKKQKSKSRKQPVKEEKVEIKKAVIVKPSNDVILKVDSAGGTF